MLHHRLAMLVGIAEQDLRTLGPLEPEVGVVVPGEADAAVHLDRMDGGLQVGFGGAGLGERGDGLDIGIAVVERRRGVVGRRLRQLDIDQHVGRLVLHGLERSEGASELHAHLDVVERVLAQPLGAAHHLVGEAHQRLLHRLGERPGRAAGLAQQPRLDRIELQARELAGLVHGLEATALEARCVPGHGEERQPVLAGRPRLARQHDDEIGGVAVEHEALDSIQAIDGAGGGRGHGDGGAVVAPVFL